MAQLTFPESMEKLDVNNTEKSFNVLQNYIGYMCERTDFSMRNMTKLVNAAGVSSVELYILVQAQAQEIATLQSTVATLTGDVAALKNTVGGASSGLVKAVADIQDAIGDTSTPGTINYKLDDLDQRVTALENE